MKDILKKAQDLYDTLEVRAKKVDEQAKINVRDAEINENQKKILVIQSDDLRAATKALAAREKKVVIAEDIERKQAVINDKIKEIEVRQRKLSDDVVEFEKAKEDHAEAVAFKLKKIEAMSEEIEQKKKKYREEVLANIKNTAV